MTYEKLITRILAIVTFNVMWPIGYTAVWIEKSTERLWLKTIMTVVMLAMLPGQKLFDKLASSAESLAEEYHLAD